MIGVIALRRLRLNLRSGSLQLVSAIMILLVSATLPASSARYQARRDLYDSAVSKHRKAVVEARFYKQLAVAMERPPDPLSVVADGLGEVYGSSAVSRGRYAALEISAREPIDALEASEKTLDFVGVLGPFLTLLALLTSYGCISGERETSTLQWTLSNSVPRISLLIGEFVGCFSSLLLPLLGSAGVALVLYSQGEVPEFSSEETIRLLMISILTALLLSSIVWMGLTFSALAQNSSTSFILCFGLWILLSLVLPNLVWWSVSYGGRLESEFVTVSALSTLDLASQPLKFGAETEARDSQREANLNRRLENVRKADSLSLVSPLGAFQSAVQALCRTGMASQLEFIRQGRRLSQDFSEWQSRKLAKYPERENFYRPAWGPLDVEGLPAAEFENVKLGDSLEAAAPQLAVLLFYNTFFFLLAAISVSRYDVRSR